MKQVPRTCLVGLIFLTAALPSAWTTLLISNALQSTYLWFSFLPTAVLSVALSVAAASSIENRLPVCALIIASLAAGVIWPTVWFVGKAAGLGFLWLAVGTALTGAALACTSRSEKLLASLLFASCVLQLLLGAIAFAHAAGTLDVLIFQRTG